MLNQNGQVRAEGVEVRVHGIGDHATYSALGRPIYKELVDSRVWIGQVPRLPAHPLRLVNWSRANRKLTRHLSWYLAFPFTLLNVAGYMEPKERVPRYLMRAGIAVASVALTISIAAWITLILETCWQRMGLGDDRLTAVVLQAIVPGLFIVLIAYRMIVGRVLVDRGGALISLTSIVALVGMIQILHTKPGSNHDWLHRYLGAGNTLDAMTAFEIGSTSVVLLTALGLCVLALWRRQHGAPFAGAAVLLVLAVSLLHTAGSMLRLFVDGLFRFVPSAQVPGRHIVHDSYIQDVLLPEPSGLRGERVAYVGVWRWFDLTPVFFLAMVAVVAVIVQIELHRRRNVLSNPADPGRPGYQAKTRTHALVEALPTILAPPVAVAIVATGGVWILMGVAFAKAQPWFIDDILMVLNIVTAIVILLVIVRRPEKLAERLRTIFGSVADIAGFWAPDLHPLAGASYRRALLAGIRQSINDLMMDFPNCPIALVGHSQGSVVCAWFVRGGHWTEQPTEGRSDRRAVHDNLHRTGLVTRSDRIALYTCGSPLSTLYKTFFPRYFDDAFFTETLAMTYKGAWWRNYWRKTDPIGSELPIRRPGDNIDVTERVCDETVGHGEYWREDRLRNGITKFFDNTVVKNRQLSGNRSFATAI
ncbi:hypothetical protein [Mycolicibacterium frederiksbergense]|uniref:hypothetical protein n=1 Tax=Mycolicibacterium frederiksbergense TaxID=117567 RepID=UPI002474F393|nr:hypothetical protein [Mycolicibacterium frederiksbergense]